MLIFVFLVLNWKYCFLGIFGCKKNENFLFKVYLAPKLVQTAWIQWWCSLFLCCTRDIFFADLAQNFKIILLFQICKPTWQCSFFYWSRNTLREIGPKIVKVVLSFCLCCLIWLWSVFAVAVYLKFLKMLWFFRTTC